MAISSKSHFTKMAAFMILLEVLIVILLTVTIVTFVSKQFPLLTFDTSSIKTQMVDQGVSKGNLPDWYELHYLWVCKGLWQSGSPQLKNKSTTICMPIGGDYNSTFSQLLTADIGLPVVTSPPRSVWDWAVLNSRTPFICLAIAIAFTSVVVIAYFITTVTMPDFTTKSPCLVHTMGFLATLIAINALNKSLEEINSLMRKVLEAKQVKQEGITWSIGRLNTLIGLGTSLMFVISVLTFVFVAMIRPSTGSSNEEIKGKDFGISSVQ